MSQKVIVEDAYLKALELVDKANIPYLIIGGIAAGALGEPRYTIDVDLNIVLKPDDLIDLLKYAKEMDFSFKEEEVLQSVKRQEPFRFFYGGVRIDFLISSTEFEASAFKRRQKIRIYNKEAYFPTPEDLIVLKIVAGRRKDMMDVESVMIRHKGRLDTKYMDKWVRQISDEAEDKAIWNRYQDILKEVYIGD